MSFISEFKDFINRGNVMDMAVGVIIGGAFTTVVNSLTSDIIKPFINLATGGSEISGLIIPVPGMETGIDFSAFISAVINFLIVAFVLFIVVRAFNKAQRLGNAAKGAASAKLAKTIGKTNACESPEEETLAPVCPYCLEEVKAGATRCPHCAAALPAPAQPTPKTA